MRQNISSEEKYNRMITTPVSRLVSSLAVPTIISMLITSVYNMADTYFVSRISTSASGAVGISFALMAVIQALGFTFGAGAGNYISRLLGQKDREHASKVAATSFFTALGLGAVLALLGLLFLDPLVYALGATDTIAPHAKNYMRYILIGMPYMIASFVLNLTLRFQGSAYFAMLGIGAGSVLNVILDPIFIFKLKMGTGGAALATIISQFISFCILYFNCGFGGNIRIRVRNFTPKWEIYKEILRGGLPSFNRQALASIAMISLNQVAGPFGDAAIAAMSIVSRTFQFAIAVILGFGQGFQPVCGFNYGAKRYDRVQEAFWFCFKTSFILMVIAGALMFNFSTQVISFFRKEDLEVVAIGSRALRFQSVIFPLSAWIIMINMTLQTIGKGTLATILSISRHGLFFLPVIFTLPHFWGITGLQVCQPVADIFTFLVALLLGISMLKELKAGQRLQEEGLEPGFKQKELDEELELDSGQEEREKDPELKECVKGV
jgi:putative MATE family efflux protein